jgi:hypothetical protein
VASPQRFFCRNRTLSELIRSAEPLCHERPATSLILDKGKPVERPGRKAKGRWIVSVGSLAAERVKKNRSGY